MKAVFLLRIDIIHIRCIRFSFLGQNTWQEASWMRDGLLWRECKVMCSITMGETMATGSGGCWSCHILSQEAECKQEVASGCKTSEPALSPCPASSSKGSPLKGSTDSTPSWSLRVQIHEPMGNLSCTKHNVWFFWCCKHWEVTIKKMA